MSKLMFWYLQMNGTEDVRDVFFAALDKRPAEKKMLKGANSGDMYAFLVEVQRRHLEFGRVVNFKWIKQCGVINDIAINNFNVDNGLSRCMDRVGNYMMFGQSKRSSEKYLGLLRTLKRLECDDEKFLTWSKFANGCKPMDHAIGVGVRVGGEKMLYDNGFVGGSKEYSLYNIADRMGDIKLCFAVDLWEE